MSDFDPFKDNDDGVAVQEAKPKLKRPPLYKVILLNDDFTPMDFVIEILMDFFAMQIKNAKFIKHFMCAEVFIDRVRLNHQT